MQFTTTINQVKALEWGLNAQQALLFAFVYECPSWAKPINTKDGVFYALSKAKIVEELPLLTDKPDTAYRMLRALRDAGVIEMSSTGSITLVRLTEKGATWNKKTDGSEKFPPPGNGRKKIRAGSEKNPSRVGKKSEEGSEKFPTNQDTSNQDTSNQDSQGASGDAPRASKPSAYPEDFEGAWFEYPNREGSNPKNHAYSAWKARKAEGVSAADMLEGVKRYAQFVQAKGSYGTGYVMQAKRFFGTSREFENDWAFSTIPPDKVGRQTLGRHSGLQAPDTSTLVAQEDGTYEF